jgi:hypothetical protein
VLFLSFTKIANTSSEFSSDEDEFRRGFVSLGDRGGSSEFCSSESGDESTWSQLKRFRGDELYRRVGTESPARHTRSRIDVSRRPERISTFRRRSSDGSPEEEIYSETGDEKENDSQSEHSEEDAHSDSSATDISVGTANQQLYGILVPRLNAPADRSPSPGPSTAYRYRGEENPKYGPKKAVHPLGGRLSGVIGRIWDGSIHFVKFKINILDR